MVLSVIFFFKQKTAYEVLISDWSSDVCSSDLPIAHMVWYAGADAASTGLIFGWGALDFAGGTVVHINAGVAALVGCLIIGKRTGYQKDIMAPHSLTMTLIGTGLLW